jgi:hypothetical protein
MRVTSDGNFDETRWSRPAVISGGGARVIIPGPLDKVLASLRLGEKLTAASIDGVYRGGLASSKTDQIDDYWCERDSTIDFDRSELG